MSFDKLLSRIASLFKAVKLPYMLVGGFAVAYWGYPRQSIDIDVVVDLDEDKLALFLKRAARSGFVFDENEIRTVVRVGNRFVMELDDFRIDCWIPRTPAEKDALARRRGKRLFGRSLSLISAEDLIIAKLLVGRARDLEDVKTVLVRQGRKLNKSYLDRRAAAVSVLPALNKLRKSVAVKKK
jgi:hypothetical protein